MSAAKQSEESEGQASMSLELQLHVLRDMWRLIERCVADLDTANDAFLTPEYKARETVIADLQGLLEAGETVQ